MFLAISGMMMAGLLIAVSGGINKERYRDATNSFTDFLKEQYNLVDNVQNARVSADGGGPLGCIGERATTDCTIIGRFIQYDGTLLRSLPIIATTNIVDVLTDSGLDKSNVANVYEAMALKVPTGISEMNREYTLRWQTRLIARASDSDTPGAVTRTFRMVLLRSPLTSTISTYYADGATATPVVMDVVKNVVDERVYLCVDPSGLAPEKTGVSINTRGVNSSAVQYATPSECRA